MGNDNITSIDAAETPQPLPCKHVPVPGQAHCEICGEQILYTGLPRTVDLHDRRTGPYWQHVALISIPVLLLIGPFLIFVLVLRATYRWVKAQPKVPQAPLSEDEYEDRWW